jgi:hypothetical protein
MPGEEIREMRAVLSKFVCIAGVVLAAAPGVASAEGWGGAGSRDLATPLGEYLLLGGGVTDFTSRSVKDQYRTGGTWDVRVGIGSRSFLGFEAAYVGSSLAAEGNGSDLLSNGAEGVLRLQYPYVARSWLVEPFVFGGIGWQRVSLREAPPGVQDRDDVGVVPFGGGITAGYGRWLLDARFTYRSRFNEDLALATGAAPANLDQWAVSAAIGYEF